jgi:WD40 repeat protein
MKSIEFPRKMAAMRSVRSVRFTQEGERAAIGLSDGFVICSIEPWRLLAKVVIGDRPVDSVVAFPNSSVAVFCSNHKSVCVYDWSSQTALLDIESPEPVHKVLAVSRMFALVSESGVKLYTYSPPNFCFQYRCLPNTFAPGDFCENSGRFLLAMSGPEVGGLQLFVVGSSGKPELELDAANHPLSIIRFNRDGSILATASERGTLIRLFDTRTGETKIELRRGLFPATICSIAFSSDSKLLAVLSNKGTVHLFETAESQTEASDEEPQRAAMMWKMGDFEPSVVEFLTDRKFGLMKFRTGVMELFRVDVQRRAVIPDGRIDLSGLE